MSRSEALAAAPVTAAPFDVERIRKDFPALHQQVHGHPLVYLDNAATSQKPLAVIEAERQYYLRDNANIHRGVHELSMRATDAYEAAREKICHFLGATSTSEVIFLRGTTEGINLVAASWGRANVREGDEILVSALEHHSNIVPWQMLAAEKQAILRVIPMNDAGELLLDDYERLLGPRTRIVAVGHVSNALGTVNPIRKMTELAHRAGARVLVDGAQAAPHLAINVRELGCDFYCVSSHKMFGPTGAGALWAKKEILESMPPWQGGGDMIASVTFEKSTWNVLPFRFEAGTPNIAGGIGFGAAADYIRSIGIDAIASWEHELLEYATRVVSVVPGVRLIGTAREKASVLSFVLEGVHPHDIGTVLDQEGIAIRTGHHCAQPVMDRLGIPATARASFAFYNTKEEADRLATALGRVVEVFG